MRVKGAKPVQSARIEPDSGTTPASWQWIGGLLLCLVTLMVFWPVREFDFVNYDDGKFVFKNDHVLPGLTGEGITWAFTSADQDYWRPLSWLSHMLDIELFGLNAGGHHLTNLVFHLANVVLLFWFLLRALKSFWPALITAALFAWHPLHVESVAWISERKDVMCGFFWLLGLCFYAVYCESGRRKHFIGCLVSFALGLMSKPMIVTFPFLLLLLDIWPFRRWPLARDDGKGPLAVIPPKAVLLEKIPFFALTVVCVIATFLAQRNVGAVVATEHIDAMDRFANAVVAYATYLGQMIWPTHMAVFYPYNHSLGAVKIGGSLLVLAGIAVWAGLRIRRNPEYAVCFLWFLGLLLPVIGLVQVGDQARADRYTYMPAIGIFLAVTWWFARGPVSRRWGANRAIWVWVPVLGAFALTARSQVSHWRDTRSLMEHALNVTERNHVAMGSLANILFRAGERERALQLYAGTIELGPTSPKAHYNYATALEAVGRIAEAKFHYQTSIQYGPTENADAFNNLGTILFNEGRHNEALALYQEAIRQEPGHFNAAYNLADSLREMGHTEKALEVFRRALALKPDSQDTVIQIIGILAATGKTDEAMSMATKGIQVWPDSPDLLMTAGSLLESLGRVAEALQYYQRVNTLQPGSPAALIKLAHLHANDANAPHHSPDSALRLLDEAERAIGAPVPNTMDIRAAALAAKGDFAGAARVARRAAEAVRTTGNTNWANRLAERAAEYHLKSGEPGK